MSKRMNIVWMEKQGAMINALEVSKTSRPSSPLRRSFRVTASSIAVGKRLVGALIDQPGTSDRGGRHYFTSTGAPAFAVDALARVPAADTLSSTK